TRSCPTIFNHLSIPSMLTFISEGENTYTVSLPPKTSNFHTEIGSSISVARDTEICLFISSVSFSQDTVNIPPRTIAILMADRKSTRLNSSHVKISYAVFCLKKKNTRQHK